MWTDPNTPRPINSKPIEPESPARAVSPTSGNRATVQEFAGVSLIGRILLSAIFLVSGISKIVHWGATDQYMSMHGIPIAPFFLFWAIVIEVVCGLSILFGLKARWGAGILFLYLIPVTLVFHDFWALQGIDSQAQLVNFLKNLAIMGGLVQIIAMGPGRISIDASSYHRGPKTKGHPPFLDTKDTVIRKSRSA